jgi:hypothetical protein
MFTKLVLFRGFTVNMLMWGIIPYNLENKQQWLSHFATRLSDFSIGRSDLATVAYFRDYTVYDAILKTHEDTNKTSITTTKQLSAAHHPSTPPALIALKHPRSANINPTPSLPSDQAGHKHPRIINLIKPPPRERIPNLKSSISPSQQPPHNHQHLPQRLPHCLPQQQHLHNRPQNPSHQFMSNPIVPHPVVITKHQNPCGISIIRRRPIRMAIG